MSPNPFVSNIGEPIPVNSGAPGWSLLSRGAFVYCVVHVWARAPQPAGLPLHCGVTMATYTLRGPLQQHVTGGRTLRCDVMSVGRGQQLAS